MNIPSRRILMMDPFKDGHRVQHVSALLVQLNSMPHLMVDFYLCVEVINKVLESGVILPDNASLNVIPANLTAAMRANNRDFLNGYKILLYCIGITKSGRYDLFYFLHLDSFLPALAFICLTERTVALGGLLFKPDWHYKSAFGQNMPVAARLKGAVRFLLLKVVLKSADFRLLNVLDEHAIQPEGVDFRSIVLWRPIPDLSSIPEFARLAPDLPKDWSNAETKLLLFGAIDERKGYREIIAALAVLSDQEKSKIGLLLCGTHSVSCKNYLASNSPTFKHHKINVNSIDRYLEDDELWGIVKKSDIILVNYRRHIGSSGVLCWAAAAGKPVLAQDFGLIGAETRAFGLGITVPVGAVDELAKAIRLAADKNGAPSLSDKNLQAAYAKRHTAVNFASGLLLSIDEVFF